MLFNSFQYAAFLAAVVGLFWILPNRERKWLLFAASYVFYAWVDWRFCFILLATTVVDYSIARLIHRTENETQRKTLVGVSVGVSLVTLAFFKYFDWFARPVERVVDVLGFTEPKLALAVILPIGISFYTFSSLSYTIDVYRREIEPTKSLLTFAVFVSYFPHLLAGPIVRARRMIPQIENMKRRIDPVQLNEGLELILIGLFQKVAVADALAPLTTSVFDQFGDGKGHGPGWLSLWLACLASVIQFTFDFAGYSNIARGSSKLLGIELPYNFRQPLTRSRNFRDFWRRNHMTMMSWFRDYLYRPLYRRRAGRLYNSLILCVVFAASGLWHGDSLVWLTWGFVMGGVVAVELWVSQTNDKKRRERAKREKALVKASAVADVGMVSDGAYVSGLGGDGSGIAPVVPTHTADDDKLHHRLWLRFAPVYVFVVVAVQHAWVRTGSVGASMRFYRKLLWSPIGHTDPNLILMFGYAVGALLLIDHRERKIEQSEGLVDPMTNGRLAAYTAMGLLILVFSEHAAPPFVYFGI